MEGKIAEDLLASDFRSRKRFAPSVYFSGMEEVKKQNWIAIHTRTHFLRGDGKDMEVDIRAESSETHVLLVEVKKKKVNVSLAEVEDFWEKVERYRELNPEKVVLSAFLGFGDFQEKAKKFCRQCQMGMATKINYINTKWTKV